MGSYLKRHFERIVVLNLPSRRDRRERLERHLVEMGLAEPDEIEWTRAVAGELCRAPGRYRAGPGAWGCLHSHIRVAQDAIMDGVERLLVLEDDVIFHRRCVPMMDRFFRQLPGDWDQIYLGGQHMREPVDLRFQPFVFRGASIHRTHAFALTGKALPCYLQHITSYLDYFIGDGGVHVDHQLGIAHEKRLWNVYAPAWWIAGQMPGSSDISGQTNPTEWWQPERYAASLPFIWIAPGAGRDDDELVNALHCGHDQRPGTFMAKALSKAAASDGQLEAWLHGTARDALWRMTLPGLQHPAVGVERLKRLWPGRVFEAGEVALPRMLDYPFNGLFQHPVNKNREAESETFSKPGTAASAC